MNKKYLFLIIFTCIPVLFLTYNNITMTKTKTNIQTETAVLAGGCFWGMEELIREKTGVIDTTVGYTGGNTKNPSYQDITTGTTGHAEAVQVIYNPEVISYSELLKYFFIIHNPMTINRQGNDIGTQYRSAIFYKNNTEKLIAQDIIQQANNSGKFSRKLSTKIEKLTEFYPAEEYHQDYLQKNPHGYTCHIIHNEQKF